MGRRRKRGRPRRAYGEGLDAPVNVRVRRDERRDFVRAAKGAGLTLSQWIRNALLSALAKSRD